MSTSFTSDLRKNRIARRDEFRKARLDVVISSAESALKSAFLVNGGGAVALLAFFGQAARQSIPGSRWIALTLFVLVVGTALAAVATGLSFIAQYGYMLGKRRSWFGRSARSITAANIVLVLLSYICFVVAGFLAYKGLG
jgi:hypothetical protein